MKHTLQLLILFFLIVLFENCSKKKADISPVNPTADFSYEIKDGIATFTNKSENAVKYLWDFGDGQTSIEKDPVHTYSKAGEYKVKLTAESIDVNKSIKALDIVILDKASGANFTFTASSYDTPCVVNFKNESTVVGQYFEWDFGDGSTTTLKDARHVYIHGGIYTITLSVKDVNSKIVSQFKQQIKVNETLYGKKQKTATISRIWKNNANSELGRDTTVIAYNEQNKVDFVRSGKQNKEPKLFLFDYSDNQIKCNEYSPDDYADIKNYLLKLSDKGYLSEVTYKSEIDNYQNISKYKYSADYITEIRDFTLAGVEREVTYYTVIDQNLTQEYYSGAVFNLFNYEVLNESNTLPMDINEFIIKSNEMSEAWFLYDSFVYFYNAKPYKNLIKSKKGFRDADFKYFKDSQGRVIKVIATNLSDRSTVETSISYQ